MKSVIVDQLIGLIVLSLFLLIPVGIFFLLRNYSLAIRLVTSIGTFLFLSLFSFFIILGSIDLDLYLLEESPQKKLEFNLGSDISVLVAIDNLEAKSEASPARKEIYENERDEIFSKISIAVSKWGEKTLIILESIKDRKEKEGTFDSNYQKAYEEVREFILNELLRMN